MRFGSQLRKSIYRPWRDQYIDYDKLKKLLKEDGSDPGSPSRTEEEEWTEEDESAFVEELVNVQLEKVHNFHSEIFQKLKDQTNDAEAKLNPLGVGIKDEGEEGGSAIEETKGGDPDMSKEDKKRILEEVLQILDNITAETNELEKYSRINYTGFLKAGKKHDRRRGQSYRVRPLLQVRLASLPFYKEDYSPLLYRLSAMYSFCRQNLAGKEARALSFSDSQTGGESFTSYKFWVHPDNLWEVKTIILRRLPVLVYNPQTSKVAEGSQPDPTITSIYFDNPSFSLYTTKVLHEPDASSLRLRWYGQLADKPEILLEKKTIKEGNSSEEQRFPIKEKYIQPFIRGQYKMEKSVAKMQERSGDDSGKADELQKSVDDIQSFILDKQLQPVLRANYSRTAFQIPGDDRIRISLDTNLALIREDAIDVDRPCREPDEWHRKEIDDSEMEYPFTGIKKGEINRFPFALLEIKVKGGKKYPWVTELMNSHLVKEATKFSKFVHGVANLFEDYVNSFPFWLSQVETDIRRDPHEAFEEEQERKAKEAQDDFAVGSLFGTRSSPAFKPAKSSPVGSPATNKGSYAKSQSLGKATAEMSRKASVAQATKTTGRENTVDEEDSDDDGVQGDRHEYGTMPAAGLRNLFPSFSTSKYARAHQQKQQKLPPGVEVPSYWIKDQGAVKVEPKVWLANQRTFIKWQHVSVLLASLSLGLFNAAGQHNTVARSLGIVYTVVAVFAGIWGWAVYYYRSKLIRERSGKDFDMQLGPVVVCIGLIFALCLNFGFKYKALLEIRASEPGTNHTQTTTDYMFVSEL
ncbi:SPX-domain-containing protein [Aulographum hederae CBS 113979]|uniref:SPX-domain-containing protein n=1 Tax=Aulographum hederae CBS 113979 TaxID=1176131 RepID=A0A6G1HBX0_9PEZI|nr:SPX-domain-containing protein [Aulographum hederae CBS 113979]